MELHAILSAYNYLTFGAFVLFFYQMIVNCLLLRQNLLNRTYMKSLIGLCAFSTIYAFLSFLLILKISVTINIIFLHITWIAGSLGNYFYISSIKFFINDRSDNLKHIQKLSLISAGGAFICLMIWALTGENYFLDRSVPFVEYNNIFMQQIGGMNPGVVVKILSLFVVIPSVYCSVYFLRTLLKSKKSQALLLTGITFNLLAILNDVLISFWDPAYLMPFIFMAHFFEILRMTYANHLQLGKKLQQVTNDLIQSSKLSEAGTNFAFLAHEILNPLSAAMGYLVLLQKKIAKSGMTPEIEDSVMKIERQHKKIQFLANNVKKYTRINPDAVMSKANLRDIIQDSLDTIEIIAMNSGVSIKCQEINPDIQLSCHPDQLIQVITNLLTNAVEAVRPLEEKWIEINQTLKNNSTVIISVKDSGRGISPEIQSKIWESRFTTKKDTGVGLGLSLCSSIITSHGGEIYLNCTGTNTEFILEIPL